jgi:hypothetical protein
MARLASGFSIKIELGPDRTHAAELHSERIMFVNIQTLIKLSTVTKGARIQSVK